MCKSKIYIAGHHGMVGSAIKKILQKNDKIDLIDRRRSELDLINQDSVNKFFKDEKPDQVSLAAAKVGGIYANNNYPAEFIYKNLMIEANIIHSAFLNGVKKILFLGSSCIYPKLASQPIKENALLTGPLELTNEPYAIAKIAGIKLCESYNRQYGVSHSVDYRCIMPTNLYGPGDNYDLENSHVIPALIRRFHEAKIKNKSKVAVWGSGNVRREFLYVDDLASAAVFVMNIEKDLYKKNVNPMCSHINVGTGFDLSIKQLAEIIKKITKYPGKIDFDSSKLEGSPKKLMDSGLLNNLGWKHSISLEDGLTQAYEDFVKSL
jgi:GDP-L-fucose synthase